MQLGKKDSEMPGQTASASDHIAPPFTLIKTNPFDLWDPSENLLSASLQCISINEFSFVLLVSFFATYMQTPFHSPVYCPSAAQFSPWEGPVCMVFRRPIQGLSPCLSYPLFLLVLVVS